MLLPLRRALGAISRDLRGCLFLVVMDFACFTKKQVRGTPHVAVLKAELFTASF